MGPKLRQTWALWACAVCVGCKNVQGRNTVENTEQEEENKSCSIRSLQNLPGALPETRESPDAATAKVGRSKDGPIASASARISETRVCRVRTVLVHLGLFTAIYRSTLAVDGKLYFFLSFFF